jgi:hypothetical protein
MNDRGVGYYAEPWTKADDPSRYGRNGQFNALWRTASYHFLLRTACPLGACSEAARADEGAGPTCASDDPLPIPDADAAGVVSSLWAPGSPRVHQVTLRLALEHAWPADLVIRLLHGAREATVFDGGADPSATPPREIVLDDFDGQDGGGFWDLAIADVSPGDVGTLRSWSLELAAPTPAP